MGFPSIQQPAAVLLFGRLQNIRELIDRDQGAGMISISPNDNYQYCECARCKKMTGSEGSVAGPLLNFVNRIAERLEPQYPRML